MTNVEYAMGNKVSTYGDVYSYGILLLEMFTGKRPTDDMFNDGLTLNNYVLTALPDQVEQIADPTMSLQELEETSNNDAMMEANRSLRIRECLFSIFRVGVSCSAEVPTQRMNISDAAAKLRLARGNFSRGLNVGT